MIAEKRKLFFSFCAAGLKAHMQHYMYKVDRVATSYLLSASMCSADTTMFICRSTLFWQLSLHNLTCRQHSRLLLACLLGQHGE